MTKIFVQRLNLVCISILTFLFMFIYPHISFFHIKTIKSLPLNITIIFFVYFLFLCKQRIDKVVTYLQAPHFRQSGTRQFLHFLHLIFLLYITACFVPSFAGIKTEKKTHTFDAPLQNLGSPCRNLGIEIEILSLLSFCL